MGFKSDIEIAQETPMLHIREIAKTAGVDEKYLEQYGNYKAKVDYNILRTWRTSQRQAGSGHRYQPHPRR